jgi:ketosteroid isomerase-like protein
MGAARDAFLAHCDAWNSGDHDRWIALFAEDVTFDDPVGVPTKHGTDAIERTWASSNRPGRSWRLEPRRTIECGDEVAVDLLNVGTIEGATVEVLSIEIWRVDAAGAVASVRVFFEPDPEVNDPYYVAG